ncbi:hypothetical protein NDI47_06160 [Microcoleus vaginatus GB1-A2]|uniref:hypothetical protein n=1 Tax=Microcoleus vaginatus TaxID=119532 RepID=UPI001682C415|nr:hypothetical protein [Microcoleus sp. FACHB-61]
MLCTNAPASPTDTRSALRVSAPLRSAQGVITGSMRIFCEIAAAKGKQEENGNFKCECDRQQPF